MPYRVELEPLTADTIDNLADMLETVAARLRVGTFDGGTDPHWTITLVPEPTTQPAPERPGALVWEDADNGPDADGDANASSTITEPDIGAVSMWWSLGRNVDNTWGVELIGATASLDIIEAAGIHLGHFTTDANAKQAAQEYENAARVIATATTGDADT